MFKSIFCILSLLFLVETACFAADSKKAIIVTKNPTSAASIAPIIVKEPDSPELAIKKVEYSKELAKKIKANLKWKEHNDQLKASIEIKLEPTGVISKSEITIGSGSKEFDAALIEAVKKSSPLPTPPKEIYQAFKSVRFMFNSRDLSKSENQK